ncbi:putative membrane protein [Desulfosporosinus sp. OT]|nr:putative membrane protein [Desulfosporosinus sp. OT]
MEGWVHMVLVWIVVSMVVVLLNIPFGYWRENVNKFSWQWLLAVHFSVPVIVFLRIWLGLGWHWTTFPILVGAYFCGQLIGAKWQRLWRKSMRVSGCLPYDIVRCRWIILISR